jgi:hypothetical protein
VYIDRWRALAAVVAVQLGPHGSTEGPDEPEQDDRTHRRRHRPQADEQVRRPALPGVITHVAGGKRGAPVSPTAAKLAALCALKHMREDSPTKGMNSNALVFQPTASCEQSVQQIGDAAFTRTFSRPASSSTTSATELSAQASSSTTSATELSAQGGTNLGSSEAG